MLGCALALAGCDEPTGSADASVVDLGGYDQSVNLDQGPQTTAAFSIVGCDSFSVTEIGPLCIGKPPLELTFVSLLAGTTSHVWTTTGGDPASSTTLSPTVRYDKPGTYTARLAAEGPGGTSVYSGTILVTPGGLAAPCRSDSDCDEANGLSCLCQGGACPGGLAVGLCTKNCDLYGCGVGGVCADLDRGGGPRPTGDAGLGDGGAASSSEAWRARLCLPACSSDDECRPGLACLQLATRPTGSYQRACFARVAGEVGAPCTDGSGKPDGSRCLSGKCLAVGAYGQCSEDCMMTTCPTGSECVNVAGKSAVCLAHCTNLVSCADPLLSCQLPSTSGDLGELGLSGSSTVALCAPRPCDDDLVCEPLGHCASGYCTR